MSLLSKMERRLGRLAIPHITIVIVCGQACAYLLSFSRPGTKEDPMAGIREVIGLIPANVLHGEVWRLFTFMFDPPATNPIFLFFGLYFFYFMGQALEANWGTFRYNVYLLIAYLMTVAAAFLQPTAEATNGYILGSVFLAFAYLFPEFVMYVFLVLPVKVKWAAAFVWVLYIAGFIMGELQTKLLIVASVLNFLLFFGSDIVHHIRTGHRRLKTKVEKVQLRDKPFHVCAVCGITDKTNPKMDFRYCPLCAGSWGYCSEHLLNHEHKTATPAA